ncbi:hypothetical protein R6Q59_002906 [Mikania micrantha]
MPADLSAVYRHLPLKNKQHLSGFCIALEKNGKKASEHCRISRQWTLAMKAACNGVEAVS